MQLNKQKKVKVYDIPLAAKLAPQFELIMI